MKKSNILKILLTLICVLSMSSCEEITEKEKNPLQETCWMAEEDDIFGYSHEYYIEFLDGNSVKVWGYDGNDSGSYTISGNNIYFNNIIVGNYIVYEYISANFTSNNLNLRYKSDKTGEIFNRIYRKR